MKDKKVFENCIVTVPSGPKYLPFLSFSRSYVAAVEIGSNGILIGETFLDFEDIEEITGYRSDGVVTKSNYGLYIKVTEGYYFLFVKGLKYYPDKSSTDKLIEQATYYYNSVK